VIFAAVSLVALAVTRPLVKKFSKKRVQPTNADRYIGLEGIVEETVDNTEGTGIVKVEGSTWTARSSDGSRIEKGSNITVDRIDGVKLMVSKH
jgi:membrane protein implicated in regulation of membrane protease activity